MKRPRRPRARACLFLAAAVVCALCGAAPAPSARADLPMTAAHGQPAGASLARVSTDLVRVSSDAWVWPLVSPFRLARAYEAPAHAYGPGHRGIDIHALGSTSVRAPDDGVVAFVGRVVDRGVVTIDHGGGIVSTLEPARALVAPGQAVRRGEVVASLETGGHASAGTLHLGARLDGEYISPLLLLGGVPHAVLLPPGR